MSEIEYSLGLKIDDIISEGISNNLSYKEIKSIFNARFKKAKDIEKRPNKKKKRNTYLRPALWISDSSNDES